MDLQKPYHIKEQEKFRLNPAFSELNQIDNLVPGVPYLWVINEERKIFVGIEKPWLYPQAFGLTAHDKQWAKIKKALLSSSVKSGFGHPTLSPVFDKKGAVITDTSTACCYIGGEINFKHGKWIIDNESGRFGRVEINDKLISVLNLVARQIHKLTGEKTDIRVISSNSSHLSSYYRQWKKGTDAFSSSIKLLQDYAEGNSVGSYLKLTLFRRNSYEVDLTKKLLAQVKKGEISTIKEIMNYFSQHKKGNSFESGLQKRLHFISAQCGVDLPSDMDLTTFINKKPS